MIQTMKRNYLAIAVLATALSDVSSLAPAFVPRPAATSRGSPGLSALNAASLGMPENGDPFNGAMFDSSASSTPRPQSTTSRKGAAPYFVAELPPEGAVVPPTKKKMVAPKQNQHNQGIFSPVVLLAKNVLGDEELNKIRGKTISLHSDIITSFVETADSEFGAAVLKYMFNIVDRNHNGKIEEDELAEALRSLGFDWLKEKQVHGIFERADVDHNGFVDIEEWIREAPKTLRTNLVKLAKKNGGELGFLV